MNGSYACILAVSIGCLDTPPLSSILKRMALWGGDHTLEEAMATIQRFAVFWANRQSGELEV